MHIAFITPEFPHPRVRSSAGIGTSIKNLIQGVTTHVTDASHIKFSLFVYGQDVDEVIQEKEYTLHLIAHKKYRIGGFILYRKYLNKYINTVAQKERIDVLEAPDWTGITAYMKFPVPLVIRLHGSDTYFCHLEGRTQKKKNFYFEKKALLGADTIISVSKFTAQKTKQLFGLTKDIAIIHNAIDVQLFQTNMATSNTKSILYFGTIIRKKGVLELAQAFNTLTVQDSKVQLVFLGKDVTDVQTGSSTVALIRDVLTETALSNTIFVSQVPYNEVKDYIDDASVICLPSHAEAFPMTWLEAMAMEKPMVTSDIGWASEIMIHEHTGLMVNPTNSKALASALLRVLQNTQEARVFGKQARAHLINHFHPKTIATQNISMYKKLLDR